MLPKIIRFILIVFFFVFPLFFLPITPDYYEFNKMSLLVVTVLILFFLYSTHLASRQKFTLLSGSYSLPLFALASLAVISTLFQSPNIAVAISTPLSTVCWVSGFILYFLLINILRENFLSQDFTPLKPHQIMDIFVLDATIISFYVLLFVTGIIPKKTFTPAGNLLSTAIFLCVIAFYLILKIIFVLRNKNADRTTREETLKYTLEENLIREKLEVISETQLSEDEKTASGQTNLIFYLFSIIFTTGAIFALVYMFSTQAKPLLLPFPFGWSIFLDVVKNVKTLLLGVGPSNFLTAFTLAKPIEINASAVWYVLFTSSSSFLLNISTELGIVAPIIFFLIMIKTIRSLLDKTLSEESKIIVFTCIIALVIEIMLPINMVVFMLTIVLLALSSHTAESFSIDTLSGKKNYFFLIPIGFILLIAFISTGKIYLGEYYFKKSLDAMVAGNGTLAYNYQQKALSQNPGLDRYHLAVSQTSFALANALATKKELTTDEKQTIPRLLNQSIDEARNAVSLYRTNPLNWDNLAITYSLLINFAKDSENWAIESYKQKIQLEPVSPSNHMLLGKLYFATKKDEEAAQEFREAIRLKPDLSSSHYNLGLILKEMKKPEEAKIEFGTALKLSTDDKEKKSIEQDLADLDKINPATSP